ncbi:MAG: hypothetical protein H8D94_01975 [Candidatus Pelagibacter sp.]|nr:hypothetical protein [Candidatus Pelagibacter sp.]
MEKQKKPISDKPAYQEYLGKNKVTINETQSKQLENGMDQVDAVAFIEKEYPQTAKEFKQIQKNQYELFCRKQMDYGPKNISVGTDLRTGEDVKLSLTGLWFRLNDKIERLKQLVVLGREAQNEPMIDAFKDLSVYGIIAQIVYNKKWGK